MEAQEINLANFIHNDATFVIPVYQRNYDWKKSNCDRLFKDVENLVDTDKQHFLGTIKSSIGLGAMLKKGIGDTVRVSLSDDPVEEIKVCKEILKCCGLIKLPRLVACPTCGRTQIDLIPMAKEVEEFLQTINKDITVAVMGCPVNGPGEAREADIGIAGGVGEGLLFKKGEIIKKVPQDKIVETLKEEIINNF